jgi:hypothetical protein
LAKTKLERGRNMLAQGFQQTRTEVTFTDDASSGNRIRVVNIEPLKTFASQSLPIDHPLRKLLMAERSQLTPQEYLAKLESWQALLRELK